MISIIIPVYNAENFLEKTVQCILHQTYQDFELILVNDGSTDGTLLQMERIQKSDKRIRIINKENGGLSDARNAGYLNAKGEYILFLDHDDIFSPRMLEDMMKGITEGELVYVCAVDVIDSLVEKWKWNLRRYEEVAEIFPGEVLFDKLFRPNEYQGMKGAFWGMLIPMSFMKSMEEDIYREKDRLPITYFEDVHLTYRFFWKARSIVLLNQYYVVHRVSSHALSWQLKPSEYAYELVDAALIKQVFLKENRIDDLYIEQLVPFFMTICKAWWQAHRYETNAEKKRVIYNKVYDIFDIYYKDLKQFKRKSIGDFSKIVSIKLFHFSPLIWNCLIGTPWFLLKYKMSTK